MQYVIELTFLFGLRELAQFSHLQFINMFLFQFHTFYVQFIPVTISLIPYDRTPPQRVHENDSLYQDMNRNL